MKVGRTFVSVILFLSSAISDVVYLSLVASLDD